MKATAILNLALPVYCHARTSPKRTALVVEGREYSYGELASAAARVARWVRACAKPRAGRSGPTIGVIAGRSFETYAGILGVAWAGGTYVPLGAKPPVERLNLILSKIKLDGLIVDPRGAARLSDLGPDAPMNILTPSVPLDVKSGGRLFSLWEELPEASELASPQAVAADHPAYIIFTSGTTGVPKGVIVATENVNHFVRCMRSMFHLGPNDRVAQFFETTFDVSVSEMFVCWDGGAALHTVPEMKVMAPGGFLAAAGVTFWMSVPSAILMMHRTSQLQPGALPALRVGIFGGEGFPVESARAFQAAAPNCGVYNLYGPTEATVACLYHRFSEPPIETPGRGTLSIGKPYAGLTAAIVGPDGKFIDGDEFGEIAVHGPQVALGYFEDGELTGRRFVTLDHPTLGRSRWYLTGDMGFRDQRGMFHHLGRVDNQVKVNGFRVELEEVEAHLRAVCSTDAVAAVAWPTNNGNAAGIVAFVSGVELDPPAVREKLRGRMPVYMVPTRVMPVDAIPFSTNGKVDRKVLCAILDQNGVRE